MVQKMKLLVNVMDITKKRIHMKNLYQIPLVVIYALEQVMSNIYAI